MLDPILEKLEQGYQLIYEGKIEEASYLVEELEKEKNLTQEEDLRYQLLKAEIYSQLGRDEEQLIIAEQALKASKKLGNLFLTISAIKLHYRAQSILGKHFEDGEMHTQLIKYGDDLIKSVKNASSDEIDKSKSILNYIKGFRYRSEGNYDLAMKHFNKSLEVFERLDYFPGSSKSITLHKLGTIYLLKGELDIALDFLNRSLELTEGNNIRLIKFFNAGSKSHIGDIYYQKGDLDNAIKYYKSSINVIEEIKAPPLKSTIYIKIINALLSKNSIEEAKQYLQDLYQSYEKFKNLIDIFYYKLSKALILKSSVQVKKRAKAEKIFIDLIKENDALIERGVKGVPYEFTDALIPFCDFYLKELEMTKGMEIIDEIKPLLQRLLMESERTNAFPLLAQTYLLKGKLSLFQMNIGDARQYLTQAQSIAEEHGLQLLARQISNEHDKLLEMVKGLQRYERKKVTVSERLNIAALNVILEQMQGKRALDPPELVSEEPILLLIMGRDGISYFNHPFVENWSFDDIFSSFMSAFNSFSSEIFSESIERIKIGENVILIKPVESFLICYVIRGQSYSALQKLSRFSDAIKWKPDIWDTLNKSIKTSEMLGLNNPPSLGEVVNEIFHK